MRRGRRADIWTDHLWSNVRDLISNDRHDQAYAILDAWYDFYTVLEKARGILDELHMQADLHAAAEELAGKSLAYPSSRVPSDDYFKYLDRYRPGMGGEQPKGDRS